jgi:hypothetical protein
VRADPKLRERIIIREHSKTLEDVVTGSTYEALSSDAKKAHGLNVSFAVLDELAQWPKRDLYDALTTGGAARARAAVRGDLDAKPRQKPRHERAGAVRPARAPARSTDATFLPVIFAAPDDADPWSEDTWRACNPALGDFRSLEEMRSAAEQAKALPAREPSFRLLYLNQPVDATARFLNARDWNACKASATRAIRAAAQGEARMHSGPRPFEHDRSDRARRVVSGDLRSHVLVLDAGRQPGGSRAARPRAVRALGRSKAFIERRPAARSTRRSSCIAGRAHERNLPSSSAPPIAGASTRSGG